MALPKPLLLRATAITTGTLIAVLPLLAIRILLVIGAESLQLDTGLWTKLFYLPYELLFPFILSSSLLHRQPDISTSSLTLKTLLISIASSPFVVAIFTLLVSLDARGDQSFLTTLVTILGLAPFLGVLGLAGFLFICFPLTAFGGGIAAIADYLVSKRHRKAIETLCFEKKFSSQTLTLGQRFKLGWKRFKAKFSRRQSIQHYTEVILKEEFERYRSPLFIRLADIAKQLSDFEKKSQNPVFNNSQNPGVENSQNHQLQLRQWEILLNRLRQQLLSVEQKTLRFHELLKQRLHVEELTFYRYSASVKNVYYAVMEQLDKATKMLSDAITTGGNAAEMAVQNHQMNENERAIQSIDDIVEAILTLPQLTKHDASSLNQSMAELELMIERVGDYRL